MHIIQQRKSSVCRTIILVTLLEFSFVEESLSNQNICEDRNRGRISYFVLSSEAVNWTEAWRQCNNQSATLPVICNQQEQEAFTKYLTENTRYPSAWTSARKITFDEWKWIDGQTLTSRDVITEGPPHELYTRALLNKAGIYTAADPRYKHHYLCHYSGSSCMHGNVIKVKNGCIKPSNDTRSWFDARNQCVDIDDDLAKVDGDDLVTLTSSSKLNVAHKYWIGLGNTTWRWMWHKPEPADDSGEDVKYTNWGYNQPDSRECISIDALYGGWYSVSCTERKKVVCQTSFGSDETTSSRAASSSMTTRMTTSSSKPPSTRSRYTTSSKSMSSVSSITRGRPRKPRTSTTELIATTRAMSNISESPTQRTNDVGSQVQLYSGVGAGIPIILIICIIVIIFVVRYRRKHHKDNSQSKVMNNSELNGLDLPPNKPATSPSYAPATASVVATDDALGVYAEITLAPLNQSEDEDKIQQPGIVYAALEFQKEPTYLEPVQNSAKATDQTKVGPMGDIYAIPDAKGRAGNEPANHPLLVTSQGDLYALPSKNSKSPTTSSPVGGIYANL